MHYFHFWGLLFIIRNFKTVYSNMFIRKRKLSAIVGITLFLVLLVTYWKLQNYVSSESFIRLELIPAISVYSTIQKQTINTTVHKRLLILSREFLIARSTRSYKPLTSEIKWLLNYRKFVLFVVNEINKLPNCFKYWANPLNIQEIEEIVVGSNSTTIMYKINFMVEPGHGRIEAMVEQQQDRTQYSTKSFTVGIQNELRLHSYTFLDPEVIYLNCTGTVDTLNRKTEKLRNEWEKTDPELKFLRWLPNAPMFVSNYFSYGELSFYVNTPKNSYTKYCNSGLEMLILVESATFHPFIRNMIRNTYGNRTWLEKRKVGLLFFVGTDNDPKTQANISKEIEEFDDIVQADFVDTYGNLTLKQLAIHNWYYTFCSMRQRYFSTESQPKWIFKADDDIMLNVDLLLQITKANPNVQLLGCRSSSEARHDPRLKWYMPKYMYSPSFYDWYLRGDVGYLIQSKLIPQFLQASLTVPLVYLEDVYITGLLALQVGVCPTNYPDLCDFRVGSFPCQIRRKFSYGCESLTELWKEFKVPWENCADKIKVIKQNPDPMERCLYEEQIGNRQTMKI